MVKQQLWIKSWLRRRNQTGLYILQCELAGGELEIMFYSWPEIGIVLANATKANVASSQLTLNDYCWFQLNISSLLLSHNMISVREPPIESKTLK